MLSVVMLNVIITSTATASVASASNVRLDCKSTVKEKMFYKTSTMLLVLLPLEGVLLLSSV
jgi:hypothetical protein